MLLDDRPSKRRAPRGKGRSSKHVIPIVFSLLAVALLVGVGAVAMKQFSHSSPEANNAQGPTTSTESASPALTSAPAAKLANGATAKATSSATSKAPNGTASGAFAPPGSWTLKFNSTFEGNQLDTQTWGTCYPWAAGGCSNFGNTSDPELEWYQASQDQVSNGELQLVAQREPTPGLDKQGAAKTYACRSGMVTTHPSFNFKYGYVQITAKIPFGKGLWPAFWLAASNQKWPPEVDILEHWASQSSGKVYLHPLTGARQGGAVSTPGLSSGWHTFGLYWTKTSLVWYYDGAQIFATSTGVPQQDMYLIANLADDDASPGGCTGSLDIQSVKVWQPPSLRSPALAQRDASH
jgi:beta-glucanase (GH16 family)